MKSIKLENIFLHLQDQMIAKLKTNKESILHPSTKGNATELCWLEWFKTYLPKRYQAEKAIVLDSNGHTSDQIDIVIFDRQYSPFLFNQDDALYVPAESVYAIFEVKPAANKKNIEYTGEKAKSVRILHRTNATIYHADGIITSPKKPFRILSGFLALSSDWKPFDKSIVIKNIKPLPPLNIIDLGCVLEEGTFKVKILEYNKINVEMSHYKKSLITFFLELLSGLQKLGTVPAIDIDQYAKSLWN